MGQTAGMLESELALNRHEIDRGMFPASIDLERMPEDGPSH